MLNEDEQGDTPDIVTTNRLHHGLTALWAVVLSSHGRVRLQQATSSPPFTFICQVNSLELAPDDWHPQLHLTPSKRG